MNRIIYATTFLVLLCLFTACPPGSVSYAQSYKDFYSEGTEAAKQGNYEKALESFQLVLRAVPDHVYSNYLAGMCAYRLGQIKMAIGYVEKALEGKPDWDRARELLKKLKNKWEFSALNDSRRENVWHSISNNFTIDIPAGWNVTTSYYPSDGQIVALVPTNAKSSFVPYVSVNRLQIKERRGTEMDILTRSAERIITYLKDYTVKGRFSIPVGNSTIPELFGEGFLEVGDRKVPITVSMVSRRFGDFIVTATYFCETSILKDWKRTLETCLYSLSLISNDPAWLGMEEDGFVHVARAGCRFKMPADITIEKPLPGKGGYMRFKTSSGDIDMFFDPVNIEAYRAKPDVLHKYLKDILPGSQRPVHKYIDNSSVPALILTTRNSPAVSAGFARFQEGFLILQGSAETTQLIETMLTSLRKDT